MSALTVVQSGMLGAKNRQQAFFTAPVYAPSRSCSDIADERMIGGQRGGCFSG